MVLCFLFLDKLRDVVAHLLDLPVDVHEVLIEDVLLRLLGREGVELREVSIVLLLLLDLLHVEVRLAEEFRCLEFLALLDVHRPALAGLRLHEVPRRLAADPACRHVGDFRRRNQAVHILVQIDRGSVTIDGHPLLQLHDLAEDVVREPLQRLLGSCRAAHNVAHGRDDLLHAHLAVVALQLRQFFDPRGHADLVAAGRAD